MNILIRFQHPDWIFRERSPDDVDGLLEELDPEEDELEELELMDDGEHDPDGPFDDDDLDERLDDTFRTTATRSGNA